MEMASAAMYSRIMLTESENAFNQLGFSSIRLPRSSYFCTPWPLRPQSLQNGISIVEFHWVHLDRRLDPLIHAAW